MDRATLQHGIGCTMHSIMWQKLPLVDIVAPRKFHSEWDTWVWEIYIQD